MCPIQFDVELSNLISERKVCRVHSAPRFGLGEQIFGLTYEHAHPFDATKFPAVTRIEYGKIFYGT